MIYVVWSDEHLETGDDATLMLTRHFDDVTKPDLRPMYSFRANSWEEACAVRDEIQGW